MLSLYLSNPLYASSLEYNEIELSFMSVKVKKDKPNDLRYITLVFRSFVFPPWATNHQSVCGIQTYTKEELKLMSEARERRKRLRFLKRPDDGRYVAVVEINRYDSAILNPTWENNLHYGPIPSLSDMTLKQADALWNSGSFDDNSEVKNRTYKLISGEPLQGRNSEIFYIDAVFQNKKIKKYRLRSKAIKHSHWIST